MNHSLHSHAELPEAGEQLYVTVLISDAAGARFFEEHFNTLGLRVTRELEKAGTALILAAPIPHDLDGWLLDFNCLLEALNERFPEKEPARILEARIAQASWMEFLGNPGTGSYDDSLIPCADSCPEKEFGLRLLAGRAFGSGGHPSTRLIIKAIQDMASGGNGALPGRVLDAGCGSGVLAMVAAKLGATRVVGFDICSEAVGAARENVLVNGLGGKVEIYRAQINEIEERFDLILANLTPSVLLGMIPFLARRLADTGIFVVSGFRERQCPDVDNRCTLSGLVQKKKASSGPWVSMIYGQE